MEKLPLGDVLPGVKGEYSPHLMAFTCSLSRLLLCQHQTHPRDGLFGDMSCLADSLPRVNLFLGAIVQFSVKDQHTLFLSRELTLASG